VVDLRENTEYHGFEPNDQVIRWFWEVLEEMDQMQRANFLQFVTGIFQNFMLNMKGTSKVPLDGFKALSGISGPQKFQIHKHSNPNALPTGHTWYISHRNQEQEAR